MSAEAPTPTPRAPRGKEPVRTGAAWEQAVTLLLAVGLALGIRAFVIEPFRIPSGSMFPTLLIGDHLFVNKFVYGAKVPGFDVRLPGLREPERGDIVVFTVAKEGAETRPADRHPELPREEFVKRIIGLPGDRLEFRDGRVLVNDEPMQTTSLDEEFVDDFGRRLRVEQVDVPGHSFHILHDPDVRFPNPGPLVVEPGRYFLMGDNRDHSKDSRIWGTVRLDEMKGPAFLLYWSWDFEGGWLDLLDPGTWWSTQTRWSRIGRPLQ